MALTTGHAIMPAIAPNGADMIPLPSSDPAGGTRNRLGVAIMLSDRFRLSECSSLMEIVRLLIRERTDATPIEYSFLAFDSVYRHCRSICGMDLAVNARAMGRGGFDLVVLLSGPAGSDARMGARAAQFLAECRHDGVPIIALPGARRFLDEAEWSHADHRDPAGGIKFLDAEELERQVAMALDRYGAGESPGRMKVVHRFISYALHGRHIEKDPAVRQVFDRIEECIVSETPLSTIITDSRRSLRQIERRFSEAVGFTMRDCRLLMRLARAKFQVEVTTMALTDVALDCGFCDSAHFSRSFAARYGMPPTRRRKIAIGYMKDILSSKYNKNMKIEV